LSALLSLSQAPAALTDCNMLLLLLLLLLLY
jgi:hypothetical protein